MKVKVAVEDSVFSDEFAIDAVGESRYSPALHIGLILDEIDAFYPYKDLFPMSSVVNE